MERSRALWGNWTVVASTGMRTVFVLGMTSSYHDQRNIEEESHTYHDIIQMNFIDSYHNLTLKTLTMLHWKLMYCPLAAWLLKSDDDVFVNPFTLKRVLADHHRASFLCRIQFMLKVCRPSMNCPRKWAVSPADYQHDKYPPYCLGSFYLVSSSMAEVVFAAANKTHPFVLEDVYITGIVAQPYKPRYINLEDRMQIYVTRFNEAFWDGRVLFCLFKERVRNASSYALWDKIVDYNRAMHVPAPQ